MALDKDTPEKRLRDYRAIGYNREEIPLPHAKTERVTVFDDDAPVRGDLI